jgi:RNA polymerase sigma-70 factor (ECF subfamily)
MSGQDKAEEFARVVEAHYERVLRAAVSVARDRRLAEEIVQETFLAAFRNFESFSGKSSLFTWLYRIMLNQYCRHHRREKLRKRLGFVRGESHSRQVENAESRNASPSAEAVGSEEGKLVLEALERLPAKLRLPVAMHYLDGLPLGEIAEILRCRLGTVKSRLFQARRRLCDVLRRKLVDR